MGRMFGTNGIRGVVNEEITIDLAVRLGKAIGEFFHDKVVIASDTRNSGSMIKSAVASGLMAVGVNVIDIGTVPTPAMQYYVASHDVDGGVMITASHNPPQFNGIKCVGPAGRELIKVSEEKIEEHYDVDVDCLAWNKVGTMTYDPSAAESYVNAVIKKVDAEAIRNANLTVILDCANGASYVTAPLLLSKLGVRVITLNAHPQGDFPGHPSEPTEENLKDIISLVRTADADLGIAHDGDADRTVFIDGEGNFISGDKSLSLMARYILSKEKGLVVTPVSSSSMVEEVVTASGGTVMYTQVGSPTVSKTMFEQRAVFGGEENGGMIFPEHVLCRDGAMTAAKMLECIAKNGPLSEQVGTLPKYYMEKRKIDCPNDIKGVLQEYLRSENMGMRTDTTDGLKIFHDDGWILVRPSGTEPKFRIFSESKYPEVAMERANETEIKAIEFVERVLTAKTL
ncbi:MAG: phosphoglucosamine mutase [Methanomassiliicoccaceae archaeon]|nr:phosphoglucosamine mutase [Methanomassiliicoccaceae archaeon]